MIYLDYSATTKTSDEVLDTFCKASSFIGNPNSLHKLGLESKNLIEASTNKIAELLNVKPSEVIYTSGSSESNNLAIKGICDKYKNRGKHIITTSLEHSSIYGPINYLLDNGYSCDFVKLDEFGRVDIEDLKRLITDDTILVSINAVNSEIGVLQPIDEIGRLLKKYPKCFFHSDMTQAIGKVNIDLSNVDLVSFSAHKFFGIKGIGVLIKKDKIDITPIIHGGKSTTIYRSGTPCTPLIASLAKALRLALFNSSSKYDEVLKLNKYLKSKLEKYDKVKINSNDKCIPHILNISILGVKPETMLHALEEYDIYISTQSACSNTNTKSKAVLALTGDIKRAESSIRISISSITTKEELDEFIKCFDICYNKLTNIR
ncbi:MAG: cysteine desulfurase family protein [bacterium]|nr:cysteine desulfurase family protein [bacterium]